MKKSLVRSHSDLSVERQCELLGLSVSPYYYKPAKKTAEELARDEKVGAAIDRWHTDRPYLRSRKLAAAITAEGLSTNRKEIRRFMREMDIYAVFPKPNLSKRNKEHKIYPYLLRNMSIFLSNQVWVVDITYIKIKHGNMYLTAVIDWCSCFIVGRELSDTLETAPVLKAVERAIETYGAPAIINSDRAANSPAKTIQPSLRDRASARAWTARPGGLTTSLLGGGSGA